MCFDSRSDVVLHSETAEPPQALIPTLFSSVGLALLLRRHPSALLSFYSEAPRPHPAPQGLYFGTELPPSHPLVLAGVPMHGANLFPPELPELRAAVLAYMDAMAALGQALMGTLSTSLGLPTSYFSERYMQPEPLGLFR